MEKTVELFCGSEKRFSSLAGVLGFEIFSIDINPQFTPDLVTDVRQLDFSVVPGEPLDLTGSFCTKRNVRTRFGREFLSCRRRGLARSRS